MGRIIALICLAVTFAGPAFAAVPDTWQSHIAEASARFGIPEKWIHAVITTESGGDIKAVSPKGAMGLMQLMPHTWNSMRTAFALGPDPFDPHANILAGTAYLKAMYDRYGYPALFSAYNAGPARYEGFLRAGKPLPDETKTYTDDIGKRLSGTPVVAPAVAHPPMQIASGTRLFFQLSTAGNEAYNAENPASPSDLFVRRPTQKAEKK